MSKPKKDKIVSFVDGGFVIDTTIHLPGVRSRTLRGKPWITTSSTEVRLGCIRFTNDAMLEIIRCMALQLKSKEPMVHQIGNYGEPEECKCYKTNDYDNYGAVMTGCASEWTVTEDCPIHRGRRRLSAKSKDPISDFERDYPW